MNRGQRWRFFRTRYVPIIIWLGAVAAVAVLGHRQTLRSDAVGIVEVRQVIVAPPLAGVVQSLSVDLMDDVQQGQIVALMDDSLIRAELLAARAEAERLRAELSLRARQFQFDAAGNQSDWQDLYLRTAIDLEDARLDNIDRRVQQETDLVTLERLRILADSQRKLMEQQIETELPYEETRLRAEALNTQIEKNKDALKAAADRLAAAQTRMAKVMDETPDTMEISNELRALREAIDTQDERLKEVAARRDMLVMKAPIAGRVSQIFYRSGESIPAAQPILAITDPRSNRVIAYVDEAQARKIKAGSQIQIATRTSPRMIDDGKVVKIGPKAELFPPRLQTGGTIMQRWGIPVLVGEISSAASLIPGEIVDIRLR